MKRHDGGDRARRAALGGPALGGLCVVCLRPASGNRALAARLRREGASVHHLAPWRIELLRGAEQVVRLQAALDATHCVFTSPNAVRAASRMVALANLHARVWAVGTGTAAELARRGVADVGYPRDNANSEGLLDLPVWSGAPSTVGLVTAPGGRDLIEPGLQARGWQVLRADVYRRVARVPNTVSEARLASLPQPKLLVLTSAEAWRGLRRVFDGHLRSWQVLVSSDRLADMVRAEGARRVLVARDATTAALHEYLLDHARHTGFR